MASATIFRNGQFFQSSLDGKKHSFAECVVADSAGKITHVGSTSDERVAQARAAGAITYDLGDRIVLPGFIDGHMHLLRLGQSLESVPLDGCKNLEDIRTAIKTYAEANPSVPRITCRGWMVSMTEGSVLASMIDDLDPRPIFIDEKSLHSTWCNAAALAEMGVQDMPDPEGGEICRDGDGNPTGLLKESAVMLIVWPHLTKVATMDEKVQSIKGAINAYNSVGITGAVEMAMNEDALEALRILWQRERPSIRIAAHWLVTPRKTEAENLAQVDRAIALQRELNSETSPDLRIAGIKLVCDGIIDACTAALSQPYSSDGTQCGPIWTPEAMAPVVRKADAAGLQIALHAIGDQAVRNAIDALEQNATRGRRHRIEHLELTRPEDASRLGQLGITASIQPVHADPAILRAWPRLLGEERCGRAFAYREFADGGAVLALGSDAPTAPHTPLRNVYTAATRRSAREPGLSSTVNPHFALELAAAIAASTAGSAYSCFADKIAGGLEVGLSADLAVVDMKLDAGQLLQAKVMQTWFKGEKVYSAE